MRFKWLTILSLGLLFTLGFGHIALAQEPTPARTIPITSRGFGAKLSPDGRTLVTFENAILLNLKEVDPTLLPMHVIDISTGKEIGQFSGFSDFASDAAFTSDGSQLVSIHSNGDVHVWNMVSLKEVKSFQTPLLGYLQIKMFPDNKQILTISPGMPQKLVLIDIESGAITQSFGKHFDSFTDFQNNYTQFPASGDLMFAGFNVSPDGAVIASSTANDEVGLWVVGGNQYQLVREKSEKPGLFSIRQLAFTPDGKSLVYYDASDMKTHIWDLATQSEKAALDVGADNFVLSPDGTMIVWATRVKDGADTVSVAPIDAPDKAKVVLTLPEGLQVAPRVTWLTFTQASKQIVVGGFFDQDEVGNEIYVIDVPQS